MRGRGYSYDWQGQNRHWVRGNFQGGRGRFRQYPKSNRNFNPIGHTGPISRHNSYSFNKRRIQANPEGLENRHNLVTRAPLPTIPSTLLSQQNPRSQRNYPIAQSSAKRRIEVNPEGFQNGHNLVTRAPLLSFPSTLQSQQTNPRIQGSYSIAQSSANRREEAKPEGLDTGHNLITRAPLPTLPPTLPLHQKNPHIQRNYSIAQSSANRREEAKPEGLDTGHNLITRAPLPTLPPTLPLQQKNPHSQRNYSIAQSSATAPVKCEELSSLSCQRQAKKVPGKRVLNFADQSETKRARIAKSSERSLKISEPNPEAWQDQLMPSTLILVSGVPGEARDHQFLTVKFQTHPFFRPRVWINKMGDMIKFEVVQITQGAKSDQMRCEFSIVKSDIISIVAFTEDEIPETIEIEETEFMQGAKNGTIGEMKKRKLEEIEVDMSPIKMNDLKLSQESKKPKLKNQALNVELVRKSWNAPDDERECTGTLKNRTASLAIKTDDSEAKESKEENEDFGEGRPKCRIGDMTIANQHSKKPNTLGPESTKNKKVIEISKVMLRNDILVNNPRTIIENNLQVEPSTKLKEICVPKKIIKKTQSTQEVVNVVKDEMNVEEEDKNEVGADLGDITVEKHRKEEENKKLPNADLKSEVIQTMRKPLELKCKQVSKATSEIKAEPSTVIVRSNQCMESNKADTEITNSRQKSLKNIETVAQQKTNMMRLESTKIQRDKNHRRQSSINAVVEENEVTMDEDQQTPAEKKWQTESANGSREGAVRATCKDRAEEIDENLLKKVGCAQVNMTTGDTVDYKDANRERFLLENCFAYVSGFRGKITKNSLLKAFGKFGTVIDMKQIAKKKCRIQYKTPKAVEKLINCVPAFKFNGRALKILRSSDSQRKRKKIVRKIEKATHELKAAEIFLKENIGDATRVDCPLDEVEVGRGITKEVKKQNVFSGHKVDNIGWNASSKTDRGVWHTVQNRRTANSRKRKAHLTSNNNQESSATFMSTQKQDEHFKPQKSLMKGSFEKVGVFRRSEAGEREHKKFEIFAKGTPKKIKIGEKHKTKNSP